MLKALVTHLLLTVSCQHDGRGLPVRFNGFAMAITLISIGLTLAAFFISAPSGLAVLYWFHVVLAAPVLVVVLPLPPAMIYLFAVASISALLALFALAGLETNGGLLLTSMFVWVIVATFTGTMRYLRSQQHDANGQ